MAVPKSPAMVMATVVMLMVALLIGRSYAHGILNAGASCGSQYSSIDEAVYVPTLETDWFADRVFTCKYPQFWLSFDVDEEQFPLYVGFGSPQLERQVDIRLSAVIFGPGLPQDQNLDGLPIDLDTAMIAEEMSLSEEKLGWIHIEAPANQSTCEHVEFQNVLNSLDISQGGAGEDRCHFYEDLLGVHSWPLLNKNLTLADIGNYTMVVWLWDVNNPAMAVSGKAFAALGPWGDAHGHGHDEEGGEEGKNEFAIPGTDFIGTLYPVECLCSEDFYEVSDSPVAEPAVLSCDASESSFSETSQCLPEDDVGQQPGAGAGEQDDSSAWGLSGASAAAALLSTAAAAAAAVFA